MSAPPRFDPAMSRRAALRQAGKLLQSAGLAEPLADAHILVEDATGLSRSALLLDADKALGSKAAGRLEDFVHRRLVREPVFRIVGRREFWGLDLAVTPAVLDPRPDTETIVTAALRSLAPRRAERLAVLDLGTGSGAILCALLTELPQARGIGVDLSAEACSVARANIARCGLQDRAEVIEGIWSVGIGSRFDLVVSNPPYIETAMIDDLSPEVRDHDPRLALDGGADGLDAYRAICPALPTLLQPDGLVVFEVGAGQAAEVSALLEAAGLTVLRTERDLGGHQRAVVAGLPEPL
jgi:release factor glutamine methyltransferase